MPRNRPEPSGRYGPIIDAHMHPMLPGEAPLLGVRHTPEEYLRLTKGLGIRFTAAFVGAPLGVVTTTMERLPGTPEARIVESTTANAIEAIRTTVRRWKCLRSARGADT